jgi:hypothetical protein
MTQLYITKAIFGYGTHTSSINLDTIEIDGPNSDLFRNRPISVSFVVKETAKYMFTKLKAYSDKNSESKFLEIINIIMKYSKTKGVFDIHKSNVEAINLELSTLVFKDVLALFSIKELLTYEQAKTVIDELFIIEEVHDS